MPYSRNLFLFVFILVCGLCYVNSAKHLKKHRKDVVLPDNGEFNFYVGH